MPRPLEGPERATDSPALSIVLCTFNRSHLLSGAIDALLRQSPGTPSYEIVVVDNNSTDATRDVIGAFLSSGMVRYEFVAEQGLSSARNHGIAVARAPLIAFTDDDVRVSPDWVRTAVQVFTERPDVGLIGGKVEPEWDAPPPEWLPLAGVAPLAIVDYGSEPILVTSARPLCLVGANLAIRREVFDSVGLFSTRVQRVGNGVGSTEDHELEIRALAAGHTGLYDPRMTVREQVPPYRLSKGYHRAWHQGHGRFYALMRDPSFEQTRLGTLLGVPAHVYRSVLAELVAWAASAVLRKRSAAFAHELRLRFLMAFARERVFGRT